MQGAVCTIKPLSGSIKTPGYKCGKLGTAPTIDQLLVDAGDVQDAVIATRKLRYKFLWIDSLCIVRVFGGLAA